MYQVSFQSLWYFPRCGPDTHSLWQIKGYKGDNSINIQGRIMVLPFHSLSSIYKPSFISIPFILFKIWPGQATIRNKSTTKRGNKRLEGCIRKWEQNIGCWSPKDRNKKGNTFSKRRQWCLVNSGYICHDFV